jgi:AAA+ ATPase superfamily predicted ATPase
MTPPGNEKFQQIRNPYVVGTPVRDQKMFFGREDDFKYIKTLITHPGEEGGLLVLCGARRSGKTSILWQIRSGRLGERFLPVMIDMQSVTVEDDRDLILKLAQSIVEALDDSEVTLDRHFTSQLSEKPQDVFMTFIDVVRARLRGRKLVLMFDEYEIFEDLVDEGKVTTDFFKLLSRLLEGEDPLFVIFTGSDDLEARRRKIWQRLLPRAQSAKISFLSAVDTERLIREPLKGIVEYDEGVSEELYALTAGQPFYTQKLCQSLVDRLNEDRRYNATGGDLRDVVDEIIENPLPQMIYSWGELSDVEKLILSTMAELEKKRGGYVEPKNIIAYPKSVKSHHRFVKARLHEALEKLFKKDDLLNKEGDRQRYSFKMDLWRQWLSRMHSFWQVINEITEDGRKPGDGIRKERPRTLDRSRAPVGVAAPPDSTRVVIETEPAQADVYLNARLAGRSPLETSAPVGMTRIEIRHAGYHSVVDSVELEKDVPYTSTFTLAAKTGRLFVDSTPPGARIEVDGADTGLLTPDTISDLLVVRPHSVVLRYPQYYEARFPAVEIYDDSTSRIDHAFVRVVHQLTVASDPVGATIYLDGETKGLTPSNLQSVTEGTHVLELRLPGYVTRTGSIDVPVEANMIRWALTPLPDGWVIVHVTPYGTVTVDGETRCQDVSYCPVRLRPGEHRVKLLNPHAADFDTMVTVSPRDTLHVRHRFKPGGD